MNLYKNNQTDKEKDDPRDKSIKYKNPTLNISPNISKYMTYNMDPPEMQSALRGELVRSARGHYDNARHEGSVYGPRSGNSEN